MDVVTVKFEVDETTARAVTLWLDNSAKVKQQLKGLDGKSYTSVLVEIVLSHLELGEEILCRIVEKAEVEDVRA